MTMARPEASAVVRLTGTIGARVDGLDALQVPTADIASYLKELIAQHGVVFLPAQTADLGAFVKLGRAFGDVQPAHPIKPGLADHPEVLGGSTGHVTAWDQQPRDAHNRQGGNWHIDGTFVKAVPVYSMLFAQVVPQHGGDTMFADLAGAYAALSEPFRRLVDGLICDHDARALYPDFLDQGADAFLRERMATMRTVPQPLVHVDPLTGRRSLVLNPNCILGVQGLSPLESASLLELLLNFALIPERTVRWKWSPGDVVIWDNRRLLHNLLFDHGAQEREIVRIIVGAEEFTAVSSPDQQG